MSSGVKVGEDAGQEGDELGSRLRQLLGATADGFILADARGVIIDVNPAYCRMVDLSRDELVGTTLSEREAALQPRPVRAGMLEMAEAGSARFETRHRRRDGRALDLDVSLTVLEGPAGRSIAAFVRGIGEKHASVADLEESRARFRTLFEQAPVSLWEEDGSALKPHLDALREEHGERLDGWLRENPQEVVRCASLIRVLDVNPASLALFGVRSKEELRAGLGAIFGPEAVDVFRAELVALAGGATTFDHADVVFRGPVGPIHAALRVALAAGHEHDWSRVLVAVTDLTDEVAVREERTLLATAVAAAANAIVVTTSDGVIEWTNPAFERLTGYTMAEVVGRKTSIVKSGLHPPGFYADLWRTILAGEVWHGEVVNRRKDGGLYTEEMTITPVSGRDGGIDHFIAVKQDVSERLKGKRRLEESERALQTLFTNLQGMAYRCLNEPRWRMEFVSQGCEPLTGFAPKELTGESATAYGDLIHPSDRERVWREVQDALARREAFTLTYRIQTRDGGEKFVWEKGVGVWSPGGDLLALEGFISDVTERHRTEQALREREERYRDLVERAGVAIVVGDARGRFTYLNRQFAEMVGYEPAELARMSIGDLVHPDDAGIVLAQLEDRDGRDRQPPKQEFRCLRKDGSPIHVEASATRLVEGGRVVGNRLYLQEITERRRLEEQLRQAQKMQSVGRLAGGVAHDFNNILQAIFGQIALARRDARAGKDLSDRFAEIETAAERAASLTRQLLAFSRRQTLQREDVDLVALTTGMLKMLRRLVREDVELEFVPGSERLGANADPMQIEQVLLNLVVNAGDAVGTGGRITIRTSRQAADETFRSLHPWATEAAYGAISVTDDGPGVPPDVRERIFEPFFTTKDAGKGTGLGLSTAYGIVAQHGGGIGVKSAPGQGATFSIYLPLVRVGDGRRSGDTRLAAPSGRGELVLLAEDDAGVRGTVAAVLEEAGYRVLEAVNGIDALRLFADRGREIDVALLDVVMPKMGGLELGRRLREANPALPLCFSSGYSEAMLDARTKLPDSSAFLRKPYNRVELLGALASLLGRT